MTEPEQKETENLAEVTDLNARLLQRDMAEMTDREVMEETLHWLRYCGAALAEIQKQGIGGVMKSMFSNGKK